MCAFHFDTGCIYLLVFLIHIYYIILTIHAYICLFQILDKNDMMAHHKVVRESRVLIKKVHQSVCRITGESCEDLHTELAVLMPMQTLDAIFDLEEKLVEKSYEDAMVSRYCYCPF